MDPAGLARLLILPLLLLGTAAQIPAGKSLEICLLPPDDGPCRALIPSYYYDRYSQSCRRFMYGGCEGNANNFDTREDCKKACSHIQKVPQICRREVSEITCDNPREVYFFNLSSMKCEKLLSGGCLTNGNQFPDEASCMTFCTPKRKPSFCYSPKDEGLCSANVTRYYYNINHKVCETFSYTGCGGNDNNFVRLEDCERACRKASKNEKSRKVQKLLNATGPQKTNKKKPKPCLNDFSCM
ncbi:PREDICTED: tissue factor pathway inhibitor 2 [Elephantulus edwardii]|uniref:tissue factor pathway inhibitor 2 n=1 Tax=Elephantulus edwardii TaxID=28737 RepID=UPI0003F0B534|nr:PREDICTED: tissue factor pathway inhibitor 2 [Elephantulus edwardii]